MTSARHFANSGFTLLEVMFVVVVMALLSATVLTTFASLNRAATALTGYRGKHAGARYALAVIANDIREARTVSMSSLPSSPLTVEGLDGQVLYVLEEGVLSRHTAAPCRRLCAGVTGIQVDLLTRDGAPAADAGSVALIRTTLHLAETGRGQHSTNTFSLVTARRNRGGS
ncbi:MAG: hypothetical protein A2498_03685 [Lentisphaerae bacterium RIFOXYC12_FULL_60_16]|nr:MAG: hypothetical protein A2498_03685 [Lentisphaerae bacterium RIFOXYC12_FULL_60_16]OGV86003.1 MAG: hypothetical protein A2340_08480 [Lentisphaerae bacterium RIFOXYB12_FULL_60_10]